MARRVSSERLIGREAEVATIDALLAGLVADDKPALPRCLLIGGEAGVGKTRLIRELADLAGQRGYRVATGACVSHGAQILPLNAVVQLQEALTGTALARTGPAHGAGPASPDPPDDRGGGVEATRLFEAVRAGLREAAASRPVVAVVEDLHWADESTRDLLTALVPRLSTEPVLFVGTYRTDERHRYHELLPLLERVERSVVVERIALAPLTRPETAALATEILGTAPAEPDLDLLYARAGGNPFLTEELLISGLRPDGIPDSLRQVVLARRQAVTDRAAVATLDAAAILSPPLDDAVLRETAGLSQAAYETALDTLAAHGLLVASGRSRDFRHELVREVVASELPPGRGSRLHRRAAEALAANQPHRAGDIARHRLAAADLPGALESLVLAGRAALRMGAAAEAAGHLERALELWPRVPRPADRAGMTQPTLLRLAATASLRGRQLDRAVELGRRAATATEAEERATAGTAWYELSTYLFFAGQAGCRPALERARELTPVEPPSALSAHIDHDLSYHARLRGETELAERLARQAVDTARRAGSAGLVAAVLSGLAEQRAERGDPSGIEELQVAIEAAQDEPDLTDVGKAVANLTYCLAQLGRDEETPAVFEAWHDRLVAHGLGGTFALALRVNALDAYEATGAWGRVLELVDEMLASYDQEGLRRVSAALAGNWGQVLLGRGEYDLAASLFLRGREEFQRGYDRGCWGSLLAGLVELGGRGLIDPVGDDEVAAILDRALPAEALAAARAVATACRFRLDRHAGPAAVAAAQSWLAAVRSAVAAHWVAAPRVLATWIDQAGAEIASAADEPPDPPWHAIAERWRELGRPYPEAYAAYRQAGTELRASPRRSRAAAQAAGEWIRRAHQLATGLGATPLARDIARLARLGRLDLGPTPAQRPAAAVPFGLTARELEVLSLVAEGWTDREIAGELYISRKTASIHVSRILRKTGTTSRFEAAAAVGRSPTQPLAVSPKRRAMSRRAEAT